MEKIYRIALNDHGKQILVVKGVQFSKEEYIEFSEAVRKFMNSDENVFILALGADTSVELVKVRHRRRKLHGND